MTQPQEVLTNYQKLLANNNSVSQTSFSSMVLNNTTLQGSNNLVSKDIYTSRSKRKTKLVQEETNFKTIIYQNTSASINPIDEFGQPILDEFDQIITLGTRSEEAGVFAFLPPPSVNPIDSFSEERWNDDVDNWARFVDTITGAMLEPNGYKYEDGAIIPPVPFSYTTQIAETNWIFNYENSAVFQTLAAQSSDPYYTTQIQFATTADYELSISSTVNLIGSDLEIDTIYEAELMLSTNNGITYNPISDANIIAFSLTDLLLPIATLFVSYNTTINVSGIYSTSNYKWYTRWRKRGNAEWFSLV